MHWHFIESPDGATDQGIRDSDYEYFDRTRYPSLVRESIQNSLDAAEEPGNSDRAVVVKFRFDQLTRENFGNENLNSLLGIQQRIEAYISGKEESAHPDQADLRLAKAMLASVKKFKDSIDVLIISDYNTHGMPAAALSGFVTGRNSSFKRKAGSAGSKGMGKAVYYALSSFRTILVSTMFENGMLFTGVSKLANHTFQNKNYSHLGYWSNNPPDLDTTTFWDIPDICRREKAGTSFFILAPWEENKENRLDQMKAEVLVNFWLSIHSGKLIVEFCDENGIKTEISKDTLAGLFGEMSQNPKYRKAVQNAESYYSLFQKPPFDEPILDALGKVSLHLDRDPKYQGKIAHFRQSGMLIFEEGAKYGLQKGMAGIFFCPDESGNTALKHLENAAHNEWKSSNLTDDEGRAEGRRLITVLNEFIREKVKEFRGVDSGQEFHIEKLRNYFADDAHLAGKKLVKGVDAKQETPSNKKPKPPGPHNKFISGLNIHLLSATREGENTCYRFLFEVAKALDKPKFIIFAGSDNERLSNEVIIPVIEVRISEVRAGAQPKIIKLKSLEELRKEHKEMAKLEGEGKKFRVPPVEFPDLAPGEHRIELLVADAMIHSLNVKLIR